MKRMRLEIEGMTCGHCVSTVDQAIRSVSGVHEAEVEIGSARVGFDDGKCATSDIVQAVAGAGFSVTGFKSESD